MKLRFEDPTTRQREELGVVEVMKLKATEPQLRSLALAILDAIEAGRAEFQVDEHLLRFKLDD